MATLMFRDYNGKQIREREDGYLSATDMCKTCGKEFKHWNENQSTKEYLKALESDTRIPSQELVQITKGGVPTIQGTWIHPRAAVLLAQWLSPSFAVQVTKWLIHHTPNHDFQDEQGQELSKAGFVYLIQHGKTSNYKIGVSKNVYKRRASLSVGNPITLTVKERFFSEDAYELEHTLHKYYEEYRIQGEWFNIPDEKIKNFLVIAYSFDRSQEILTISPMN